MIPIPSEGNEPQEYTYGWQPLSLLYVWKKRYYREQVALLLQRDRARHLSVEILQLQNISLENPIVWHYLRDSTTHDDGIYRT